MSVGKKWKLFEKAIPEKIVEPDEYVQKLYNVKKYDITKKFTKFDEVQFFDFKETAFSCLIS